MKLRPVPVKRALNKAYRREKVLRAAIEAFKANLRTLLERINTEESEENAKNHLRDFLNHTWYKDRHLIATKGRADMVIHTESKAGSREEQLFSTALELAITWVNRILFLKLLEAQLLKYHRNDAAYRFLNSRTVADFDELNELFFDVLAKRPEERPGYVHKKFAHIPYLNSSLFEISELEDAAIRINSLKDRFTLPLMNGTVLRDAKGKRRTGEMKALDYLFAFLDAYDFSSEGSEAIQEENKALINASVLGLIFEKINGYQDGSFFTPGFITMYMCRETLRRAVVQKFRESARFAEFEGNSFEGKAGL